MCTAAVVLLEQLLFRRESGQIELLAIFGDFLLQEKEGKSQLGSWELPDLFFRFFFRQVVEGVKYIHSMGIMHRVSFIFIYLIRIESLNLCCEKCWRLLVRQVQVGRAAG